MHVQDEEEEGRNCLRGRPGAVSIPARPGRSPRSPTQDGALGMSNYPGGSRLEIHFQNKAFLSECPYSQGVSIL